MKLGLVCSSLLLLLIGVPNASAQSQAQKRLAEYVNTLRGSNSRPEYSRGNTFPAVSLPFGFNFWTPITEGNSQGWLYRYDRTSINGFGVCHQPSPWVGDHASIQIMPQVGDLAVAPDARAATFRHDREIAHAHYYSVELESSGIRVEFTPTDHASRFRITYPKSDRALLLFDSIDSVTGSVRVDPKRRSVEGYVDHNSPRMYFVARLDRPITTVSVPEGPGVTGAVGFDTRRNPVVELSMATSFLSVAQARANLEREVGRRSFDEVRERAARAWDEKLGLVEIEGATERQRVTFYSNLYRAFLYPNSMWEVANGEARYFSPYDKQEHRGKIWVNNGFWDTYRAAWPLYLLLLPEHAGQMLDGFVQAYLHGGWTPRWSGPGYIDIMVGTHTDAVFADAYFKNVRNFDVEAAYQSALKNALVRSDQGALGRKGNRYSIFLGYVPLEVGESAAWTLENAVCDYGIARLADALGDTVHARYFGSRAQAYVEIFSPEVGFFRGRKADGSWRTPDADFKPHEWGYEFTEGNAWQYCAAANHDPAGMAKLYGGLPKLSEKIDGLLNAPRDFLPGGYGSVIHEMTEAYDTNMGQYAHANEPTHHVLYMHNYAGMPWKTQRWVREVMDEARGVYGPGLGDGGGYLGDEDNGQMSAWFVFSALGFYPASPAHPEYAIGSPLFTRARLRLPGNKTFVVNAPGNDARNRYIQRAVLNGRPFTRNYLTHAEITAGGELELTMGPEPSNWGSGPDALPSSASTAASPPSRLKDIANRGTAAASEEAGVAHAFDDDSDTEWEAAAPAWVGYRLPSGEEAQVTLYTVTSSADATLDPKRWSLRASRDGSEWVTLDTRSGERFDFRRQTRVFEVPKPQKRSHYRLEFSDSEGRIRLAEVEFLALESDRPPRADVKAEPGIDSTENTPPPPPQDDRKRTGSCGCNASGTSGDAHGIALGVALLWLSRRKRRVRTHDSA